MSLTVASGLTVARDLTVDDAPVALSARGDLVAVAGAGGTAKILDAAMGAELGALELPGGALCAELGQAGRPEDVDLALGARLVQGDVLDGAVRSLTCSLARQVEDSGSLEQVHTDDLPLDRQALPRRQPLVT
ncbi:hypothetical protein [Streptomyces cupreus]|uniref:Uncharacterized protein n=1 Tax=Streptomyces cupreus TaxID=2759956 RepID=A0A7X1MAZ1_9ACTN|nr:hypothetical protein [Streptomyces cupreus]MBC2904281.1 hypothetical protein [Streptomyces cupreus]